MFFPLLVLAASLAPPTPPAICEADLERFPDNKQAWAKRRFAREHVEWAIRYGETHCDQLRDWIEEAQELRRTWELLLIARGEVPGQWWDTRTSALRELYRRLGPWRWANGAMPPPAPYWRFTRVD